MTAMNYTRQNPSPRYAELIEQYRAMHSRGNPEKGVAPQDTFDGRSLPRQAARIRALIEQTGAEELFAFAGRFVFANVTCFPALKNLPNGENVHCTVRPPAYWCRLLGAMAARFPGVAWEIWAHVKAKAGYAEVRCGS